MSYIVYFKKFVVLMILYNIIIVKHIIIFPYRSEQMDGYMPIPI